MKFALLTALATAGAVVAGPMRRANGGSKPAASDMDVTILQYALTLEQ